MDPSLVDLVADGTLDAELAALLWLLVEGGVPLTVTGRAPLAIRAEVAQAVLACRRTCPGCSSMRTPSGRGWPRWVPASRAVSGSA